MESKPFTVINSKASMILHSQQNQDKNYFTTRGAS